MKITRSTNEHNHKKEAVTLYHAGTGEAETGIADDLRTRYGGLLTVEIIYALLLDGTKEPELVRIPVKGSSLGSDAKAETTTDLYSYISSFTQDEHMWQYVTVLSPVLEKGKQQYFAIDFKRGEALDEQFLFDVVRPALLRVRDNIEALDKQREKEIAKGVPAERSEREEEPIEPDTNDPTQYPAEGNDIDPLDIPF